MGKLNRRVIEVKYCACNKCGLEVKPGRTFIRGHNRRGEPSCFKGRHHSQASNDRNRETHLGKPAWNVGLTKETDERVAKYAESLTGKPTGRDPWNKGLTDCYSEETLLAMGVGRSERMIELWADPEFREKQIVALINAANTPEEKDLRSARMIKRYEDPAEREKTSESTKKMWSDSEFRERVSKIMTDIWSNPEYKKRASYSMKVANNLPSALINHSLATKANWQDPEWREKQILRVNDPVARKKNSDTIKKLWADPEYREKQMLALGKGQDRRPNRPESLLQMITREYHPGFKYTGDYSVIINGKNPDFVNEETKQVIELFGDYWHDGEDPTDRAEIFAQAGYETCVIWENELKNLDHVIGKLNRFCSF